MDKGRERAETRMKQSDTNEFVRDSIVAQLCSEQRAGYYRRGKQCAVAIPIKDNSECIWIPIQEDFFIEMSAGADELGKKRVGVGREDTYSALELQGI